MQISRYWRLNAQRYRLEGYRSNEGEVSLQGRIHTPTVTDEQAKRPQQTVAAAIESPAA